MRTVERLDRAASRLVDLAGDLANDGEEVLAQLMYEKADEIREIADDARTGRGHLEEAA